ncbi:MAG TPA: aspartyl/asparaginyl beta-hydroxylase domain-containing protein [Rhizomicrobium sp.]|nr:aspartyl/asparaginyl beta-hydroxylase domain-containing protein [Rhizomicrobium sp.]
MQQQTDPRVTALAQSARVALEGGRADESARLWGQVLSLAPDHSEALFNLGQHALYRKDARAAVQMLERALALAPREPMVALNLAFAHRALGDAHGESAALEKALAIDAYFYPALLAKAALLERGGGKRQAARIYKDVLKIVPPDGRLPRELKPQIEHARARVREDAQEMAAFLEARMGATRARHAGADFSRIDECAEVAAGAKKAFVQAPTMLHFPRLPAIQYYDRAQFPWMADIEAETDAIREELIGLLREDAEGFRPYITHPASVPLHQWAELNWSPRWSARYLWKDGAKQADVCARCPRAAAALAAIPRAEIPNFAPTAFFSALDPRTRIPPHSGDTNVRLIVHLPLIVPGDCHFRVGNDTREFKEGQAWVFDDTIEHEAWNDGDKPRVILIFDVWNPYLTAAERDLVGELLNGVNDFYRAGQAG